MINNSSTWQSFSTFLDAMNQQANPGLPGQMPTWEEQYQIGAARTGTPATPEPGLPGIPSIPSFSGFQGDGGVRQQGELQKGILNGLNPVGQLFNQMPGGRQRQANRERGRQNYSSLSKWGNEEQRFSYR